MSDKLNTHILNAEIESLKKETEQVVRTLLELSNAIQNASLGGSINEILERLEDPYMFVIVGEVKSGKSSFINALLESEKEICKVAPSPMTDTIQQIIYGEKEEVITVNPFLKIVKQPVPILQEIAIVDTPGTNTIIEHHEEITERFIPSADLIIFVFEAKNPYRQSAWDFFHYIHSDWRKKVIFILQQKDLLPENDLAVNVQGVVRHASEQGIEEPVVFAVSAKMEQDGIGPESGFHAVRTFVRQKITGGKAPFLKLQSHLSTAQNISDKIDEGLQTRKQQFESDRKFRQEIDQLLDQQEAQAFKQVGVLVENLIATFDRITREKASDLSHGLAFFTVLKRSVTSIFRKSESMRTWLNAFASDLEEDFSQQLHAKINTSISDLSESVQQMATVIDLKLRTSETILSKDHELFSQIAERRGKVFRDLNDTFNRFLTTSESFTDQTLFPGEHQFTPNVATGSGLAVIGVILATVTNGMVFDITGGVLTAIGVLFAGISLGIQRRKILRQYRKEIGIGRQKLDKDITAHLNGYIAALKQRILGHFDAFDTMLEKEERELQTLRTQLDKIDHDVLKLTQKVERQLTMIDRAT